MLQEKPAKKSDLELWTLILEKISNADYLFLKHAHERLIDRSVSDVDVLDILEAKSSRRRKRNKSKDKYVPGYQDWNYCIEGNDLEGRAIRIIISFNDALMLVVTVIGISNWE